MDHWTSVIRGQNTMETADSNTNVVLNYKSQYGLLYLLFYQMTQDNNPFILLSYFIS